MKVWMRGRFACLTASQQRSISPRLARASPQITAFSARSEIALTAAKSPSEAIGNPASMMSTPISSSMEAISSFSAWVMVAPGLCSPSRRVVSKISTRLASVLLSVWMVIGLVLVVLQSSAGLTGSGGWRGVTSERSRRTARSEAAKQKDKAGQRNATREGGQGDAIWCGSGHGDFYTGGFSK